MTSRPTMTTTTAHMAIPMPRGRRTAMRLPARLQATIATAGVGMRLRTATLWPRSPATKLYAARLLDRVESLDVRATSQARTHLAADFAEMVRAAMVGQGVLVLV